MVRNILEKLGYGIHETKRIGFEEKRLLTKHDKKGWLIINIDESEVEGMTDIFYKDKEYEKQIKSQLKNKHYKTNVEVKKHF